jgi:putative PIN family toxin of toxin-antitoxin system
VIVAVLDTNVLVSGFPARTGVPATLIDLWRAEAYRLAISTPILAELAEAWRDPYWAARFSPAERAEALALLRSAAIVTPPTVEVTGVATHPEDDLILVTVASRVTYLVTGDRRLRAIGAFRGVALLSPREFLTRLEEETRV